MLLTEKKKEPEQFMPSNGHPFGSLSKMFGGFCLEGPIPVGDDDDNDDEKDASVTSTVTSKEASVEKATPDHPEELETASKDAVATEDLVSAEPPSESCNVEEDAVLALKPDVIETKPEKKSEEEEEEPSTGTKPVSILKTPKDKKKSTAVVDSGKGTRISRILGTCFFTAVAVLLVIVALQQLEEHTEIKFGAPLSSIPIKFDIRGSIPDQWEAMRSSVAGQPDSILPHPGKTTESAASGKTAIEEEEEGSISSSTVGEIIDPAEEQIEQEADSVEEEPEREAVPIEDAVEEEPEREAVPIEDAVDQEPERVEVPVQDTDGDEADTNQADDEDTNLDDVSEETLSQEEEEEEETVDEPEDDADQLADEIVKDFVGNRVEKETFGGEGDEGQAVDVNQVADEVIEEDRGEEPAIEEIVDSYIDEQPKDEEIEEVVYTPATHEAHASSSQITEEATA